MTDSLDFTILNAIQSIFRCEALDVTANVVSLLGGLIIWWALSILMITLSKKHRSLGIAIMAATLFCIIFSEFALKPFILRDRPFLINLQIVLATEPPFGTSFPSTHTMQSFAAAAMFFGFNKRAGIAAELFALLVAFSRLYLYVHFPSDVLIGAAIGTVIGIVALMLERKIEAAVEKKRHNKQLNGNE